MTVAETDDGAVQLFRLPFINGHVGLQPHQLLTSAQAGAKFAGKTRHTIEFERLRARRTHVIA